MSSGALKKEIAQKKHRGKNLRCKFCKVLLSYEKRRNKFCNHSCAATFVNKSKFVDMSYICKVCSKSFIDKNYKVRIYCSHACHHDYIYTEYIRRWKSGLETGLKGKFSISSHIRKYLMKKYDMKCSECGWNEVNKTTGNVPVQVDHIDGNWQNNIEENLRVLCPNCHSLTSTYMALNMGHGRADRHKKTVVI